MIETLFHVSDIQNDSVSHTSMEFFGRRIVIGESFDTISKRLFWDVTKVVQVVEINGKEIDPNKNGVWNPIIDSEKGLCYTFNPKVIDNISIPITYHGHFGQINPATIHIGFNVR